MIAPTCAISKSIKNFTENKKVDTGEILYLTDCGYTDH